MCGRFSLADPAALQRRFTQFRFAQDFSEAQLPRFNVAPSQPVLGVRNGVENLVETLQWGIGGRINARAEGLANQPPHRRCIVFADGFYEWHDKKPRRFTLVSGAPFAMAGVWQTGPAVPGCAIVTTAANDLVRAAHDRMPVLLDDDALIHWLAPDLLARETMRAILRPYPPARMRAAPVSMRLNNARYDAPDVLRDDDPVQGFLFGQP